MKTYSRFIFDSFSFDAGTRRISLVYSLDDEIRFEEVITLPNSFPVDIKDPKALDRALFALHLIGGISYFKTCLPKEIEIQSGELNKEQADFWQTVYENGLGEFFYKNEINGWGTVNFPATSYELRATSNKAPEARSPKLNVLVPIGGGKDSLVAIELLKQACIPMSLLRVGQHQLIDAMAKKTHVPLFNIERKLAPELFALNKEGALNGHVPITAYLSFLSVVLSEIGGFTHVVFSNEESANEGNVEHFGKQINHQWSKSKEFEEMLKAYIDTYVTESVDVFSLLRPLSELKIMALFASHPKYFDLFTSCNANWRILASQNSPHPRRGAADVEHYTNNLASKKHGSARASALDHSSRWCGHCPKCAFSFALLAAFIKKETMLEIFGKNLFDDASLIPLYKELLGLEGSKPFECVGTPNETKAAFLLARQPIDGVERTKWLNTPIMNMFEEECLPSIQNEQGLIDSAMKIGDTSGIPEPFASLLPR